MTKEFDFDTALETVESSYETIRDGYEEVGADTEMVDSAMDVYKKALQHYAVAKHPLVPNEMPVEEVAEEVDQTTEAVFGEYNEHSGVDDENWEEVLQATATIQDHLVSRSKQSLT